MWEYSNKNPQDLQVNDCVIRAVSAAEGRSWDNVYTELTSLAQLQGTLLDDSRFIEPYLSKKYPKIYTKKHGYDMTVSEWAESHKRGIYLVSMRGHITCIKNGTIFDTWDCGKQTIWGVWEVK